jgi:hypothetical protein
LKKKEELYIHNISEKIKAFQSVSELYWAFHKNLFASEKQDFFLLRIIYESNLIEFIKSQKSSKSQKNHFCSRLMYSLRVGKRFERKFVSLLKY